MTTYLNTLARNYLPTAVYNRLPGASFWKQVAKFGKIVPIACMAWNYSTTGQVATLGNLSLLALSGLLHYLSKEEKPTPTLFRRFTTLPDTLASHALSFLDYRDLCNYSAASKGSQALRNRKDYLLDRAHLAILDRKGIIFAECLYRRECQVEIEGEISKEGIRAFLNCYYGENDPFGRRGKVRNYCLTPVKVPEKVKDIDSTGNSEDNCVNKLDELFQRSKTHPAKYIFEDSVALQQYGKTPARRARLVIKMDRVVGRGLSWQGQVGVLQRLPARWRTPPNLLSQNTALLGHHAITGERYHNDPTGKDGRLTFGRTVEQVEIERNTYQACSGMMTEVEKDDGLAQSDLLVDYDRDYFVTMNIVAGVQREFY